MISKRALFDRARRDLHNEMQVPALYRARPTDDWQPITVRLLRRSQTTGGIPGLEGATLIDLVPRMIFLVEDVALPARNAIVSIATGEAWRVGDCDPADGLTVTAEVAPIPAAQTTDYPVP